MRFEVLPKEAEKLARWLAEHDKDCSYADPKNQEAIGGRLTYKFTPNNLGYTFIVECSCGQNVDLSDYWSW